MKLNKHNIKVLENLYNLAEKAPGCSLKGCLVCIEKKKILDAGDDLIKWMKEEKKKDEKFLSTS